MPLTSSVASRTQSRKGEGGGHIHTDKWHRCWTSVQGDGNDTSSAAAICTASIGEAGSILKGHRRKKTDDYTRVLKFNPHHDVVGKFSSSTGKILSKVHDALVKNGFVQALKEIGHDVVHQYDHPSGRKVVINQAPPQQDDYPYGSGDSAARRLTSRDPWD